MFENPENSFGDDDFNGFSEKLYNNYSNSDEPDELETGPDLEPSPRSSGTKVNTSLRMRPLHRNSHERASDDSNGRVTAAATGGGGGGGVGARRGTSFIEFVELSEMEEVCV